MTWNELIYGIGDLMTWTFKILPVLGDNFNWMLIGIGFILLIVWLRQMAAYNREADQNGTLR